MLQLQLNLCFLLFYCIYSASSFQLKNAIDLTHAVNENTIAWPSNTQFTAKQVYKGYTAKEFWYEERVISGSEHAGTHLDAPVHLRDKEGGWSAGDIPLSRLAAPGIKIDISKQIPENILEPFKNKAFFKKSSENIDYQMTTEDIQNWEEQQGKIQEGTIVIVHTNRGKLYTDKESYLGRPADMELPANDVEHLHFPGISSEAARLLVARNVYGVAIDTPSLDYGQSRLYETHRILLGANIYGIENIANTEQLPAKGFLLNCLVQKLEGGSGGPVRVVAFLDDPHAEGLVQTGSGNSGEGVHPVFSTTFILLSVKYFL